MIDKELSSAIISTTDTLDHIRQLCATMEAMAIHFGDEHDEVGIAFYAMSEIFGLTAKTAASESTKLMDALRKADGRVEASNI